MKLAIFGNCQIPGVAACLQGLNPGLVADQFLMKQVRSLQTAEEFADRMAGYDAVLSQHCVGDRYGPLRSVELKTRVKRLITFPKVIFTGLHPDILVIGDRSAGRFQHYHSRIIGGAYLAGVAPEKVSSLFNGDVFRRLGYFQEYEIARTYLVQSALGCDVGAELFPSWAATGAFMYTPNHPSIAVLRTIAEGVCRRLGAAADLSRPSPEDGLAKILRFPVYPEIAEFLGVPGDRAFVLGSDEMSLDQVVGEFYAAYQAQAVDLSGVPPMADAARLFRSGDLNGLPTG